MPVSCTLTIRLSHSDGVSIISNAASSVTFSIPGTVVGDHVTNTQLVGTARENLLVGDVSTSDRYVVVLRNLDATNYVEVETYDGVAYVIDNHLEPGEMCALVVPAGKLIHLKANTAACRVETFVGEIGVPV